MSSSLISIKPVEVPGPVAGENARNLRVALINMPFSSTIRPSIQLGLLRAVLAESGISADTFHLNLDFAKQLGLYTYEKLCDVHRVRIGDWLFALAAFDAAGATRDETFLRTFASEMSQLQKSLDMSDAEIHALRSQTIPAWLNRLCAETDWGSWDVIGFTSTFEQNVAALALASRLKALWPNLVIVFGGSNCEGVMGLELVRTMDYVDYVVSGQGDVAFPRLLESLRRGVDPCDIPGVLSRNSEVESFGESPEIAQLPIPDYEEYFQRRERLNLWPQNSRIPFSLPYESSRGCWWGQKHHCTFCGLNGNGMAYRAKPAERVLDDFRRMSRRYHSFSFMMVDNILDTKYLSTLLPRLVAEELDYDLFFEVKANLTREQLKLLKLAGVHRLQPGIESLNNRILSVMRKGITALQNVNTIRWAAYYNVSIAWNILWGFPGERREDYEQQLAILKKLTHLPPPVSAARLRVDRFSPLFFEQEKWPRAMEPLGGYEQVYPPHVKPDKIAYYFNASFSDRLPNDVYEPTVAFVSEWRRLWESGKRPPSLRFRHSPGFLQIVDDRAAPGSARISEFHDLAADLYIAFADAAAPLTSVAKELRLDAGGEKEAEAALAEFCEKGLMLRDDGRYLSLALPASEHR